MRPWLRRPAQCRGRASPACERVEAEAAVCNALGGALSLCRPVAGPSPAQTAALAARACTSLAVSGPPTHSSVPNAPLPPVEEGRREEADSPCPLANTASLPLPRSTQQARHPPVISFTRCTTSSSLLTTTSSAWGAGGRANEGGSSGAAAQLLPHGQRCARPAQPHSPAPSFFRSSVWCAERTRLMVRTPWGWGKAPAGSASSTVAGRPRMHAASPTRPCPLSPTALQPSSWPAG